MKGFCLDRLSAVLVMAMFSCICLFLFCCLCRHLLVSFLLLPSTALLTILQVIDYLAKKGYNRTEAMLRMESANQEIDGRPLPPLGEDARPKYRLGFGKQACALDIAAANDCV